MVGECLQNRWTRVIIQKWSAFMVFHIYDSLHVVNHIHQIYMIYYVYVLFMWTDKRIEVRKARYNLYQQLISRVGWFSHSVFVIIVSSSHISYNHCHGGALAIYGKKHVKWLVLVNLTRLFGIMLVLECWTCVYFINSWMQHISEKLQGQWNPQDPEQMQKSTFLGQFRCKRRNYLL